MFSSNKGPCRKHKGDWDPVKCYKNNGKYSPYAQEPLCHVDSNEMEPSIDCKLIIKKAKFLVKLPSKFFYATSKF